MLVTEKSVSMSHAAVAGAIVLAVAFVVLRVAPLGAAAPLGSVATPIGETYSVHHMVGADLDQNGTVDCCFINEDPPPAAPDDIVTFDGLAEAIMTDIFGTVPTVTESTVDNADGTHRLVIDTSSPFGSDMFPEGVTDDDTGIPLTDACFMIGLLDSLDWPGVDSVTSATISFMTDGGVVRGPFDVSGHDHFTDPWNGIFMMTLENGAGIGINGVHLEILVGKEAQGPLGACCVEGECIGDIEQISCEFMGGHWHLNASCGANPSLPPPVCDSANYRFNNGFPLDDGGAPISQYAPDVPFGAGAVDDFILDSPPGSDDRCRISTVWAWMTHSVGGIDPSTDYQGVNVTVYADATPKGPNGRPQDDGTHTAFTSGGIVYSRTIPMDIVTATSTVTSCMIDDWQLDIPVDIILNHDTKYWLEVQPIMDAAVCQVRWLYSQNNNDHAAQEFGPHFGIYEWQEVTGNANACPPDTPPAGTRENLAFQLFGEDVSGPPNDDCENAILIGEGTIPFSSIGATTDGPDEPEMCTFGLYSHLESDIWFDHVATCTGELTVSLCGSGYDTKLAVYDGCDFCPPRDIPIACNDMWCGQQSQVTTDVVEGNCYRIRIGGYQDEQGKGIITTSCYTPPPPSGACCSDDGDCLGTMTEAECDVEDGTWYEGQNCDTFICPVPHPPHDECYACIPILTGASYSGSTNGATGTDTSSCSVNDTRDVWHCWTPDCNGVAIISLCDSAFNTTLSIYDSCGGDELACSDDYCGDGRQSLISPHQIPSVDVYVTAGETYFIRVSGCNGNYTLAVDDCANACCSTTGFCMLKTYDDCTNVGGLPKGDGTVCLGDHNYNGIDDMCEECPDATISNAMPPDGVVDARQPSEPGDELPRQGIGTAEEAIVITLDPPEAGVGGCFKVCETAVDPLLSSNTIVNVTDQGSGVYKIVLDRAITAGAVTTIQYTGDGSYVEYISHPANVNADIKAAPSDILRIIDYINGVAASPWGIYSEDIDRSGMLGPPDILRVIDLLNGAGVYDPWLNTSLPENTSCPQ